MNTADIPCEKITENTTNNSKQNNYASKQNNDANDRVYLCVEFSNSNNIIDGFNCYQYNSFKNADNAWNDKFVNNNVMRHTMIPICKWVPTFFDKYILNWKLKNLYWGGKINIRKFVFITPSPGIHK